jgi:SRSO17 transposase
MASLFMPQCWEEDDKRRRKAHIPDEIIHETKPVMALKMIKQIQSLKIKFGWIVFDALYGSTCKLLYDIEELGHRYMAEVRSNLHFYLQLPQIAIPAGKAGRGKKIKKLKADTEQISLKDYLKTLKDTDWTVCTIRDGSKKKITSLYHRKKIWIWEEKKQKTKALSCTLFIRKSLHDKDYKYCITNACEDTPLQDLAYAQGQRFYVEQGFKEGKNQVGMGDYQVRGWDSFHRHITCSMLTLNFTMEQKHFLKDKLPFITSEDIRQILIIYFPVVQQSKEQMLNRIKKKHDKYKKQIKIARAANNR